MCEANISAIFTLFNTMRITIFLITLLGLLCGFSLNAQVQFIPNQGQWQDDFAFKLQLKHGSAFYHPDGVTYHMLSREDMDERFGEAAHNSGGNHSSSEVLHHHAFKQKWLNSSTEAIVGADVASYYNNYFYGNNPKNWKGKVPVYFGMRYKNVYPKIDLEYYQENGQLKYNWVVMPGGDPQKIAWQYEGANSVSLSENTITISTSVGNIAEYIPNTYTLRNGIKTPVKAQFVQKGNTFLFSIDNYDKTDTLVIDPVVVFASFTGSISDNWGFTATYDNQGNLYGGGIVFSNGYPTTTGAFQTSHNNPTGNVYRIDIGISKFNATGNNLLYSTYIGGNGQDQPHSLFVDTGGNLFIFGSTGSSNFPVTPGAYSTNFSGGNFYGFSVYDFVNGSDVFVAKLNATGTNMLACTYLGGSGNDGLNASIVSNYADQSRGEIVLDANNNVYITGSTLSNDFPLANAAQTTIGGQQDAFVAKLSSNLSTLIWSTYYGGTSNDAGYGLKVGQNGSVYVVGSTRGGPVPGTSSGYWPTYRGGTHDGYIAQFDGNNGALINATYVGTAGYDQSFLIDIDKLGSVYVVGQTGGAYPVTAGSYNNANGKQFIHKFSAGLNTSVFSTRFGSGSNAIDIVPIALNVDECLNILLSGWGGVVNGGNLGGNTNGLPTTPDAAQRSTDGSDLYFAVFSRNAASLKYATFFGGPNSPEHVDGGTSRFDPNGNIYQAVCAGCGGRSDFPTTPGAWSRTNNSRVPTQNCNLAVVKIDFETSITAKAEVDSMLPIDTSCYALTLNLDNLSKNANLYFWDFGNGQTSTLENPTVTYDTLGTYTIKLVATDTVCDVSDSVYLTVNHIGGSFPTAIFATDYVSCNQARTTNFINTSTKANTYLWDFGDGTTSTAANPTHNYAADGTYTITLFASDTACPIVDRTTRTVTFNTELTRPEVNISDDSCFFGGIIVDYENDSSWYTYEWRFGGTIERNKYPRYRYHRSGTYYFTLTIRDTLCEATYFYEFEREIQRIDDRVFIPNAFTPNRDLINEEFIIAGNNCLTDTKFQIFDSFGNIVFETEKPFSDFWDGYIDGKPAQEDVYVYLFQSIEFEKRGTITVYY